MYLSRSQTIASRRALLHKRTATHPLREEINGQFELLSLRRKSSTATESLSEYQSLPLTSHQTLSILSKPTSTLEPDSDEEEESDEFSSDSEASSSCASVPPRKGVMAPATIAVAASSKKTTDSNSDEWYSESEANWTNVDAYNKETASQVLSSITASTNSRHPEEKPLDGATSHPTISSASPNEGLVQKTHVPVTNHGSRDARVHMSTTSSDGGNRLHSTIESQK